MDERKEYFEEKKFSRQNLLGGTLFPSLVKAKNQHQNFEKHLKQKRCAIRPLTFVNFF